MHVASSRPMRLDDLRADAHGARYLGAAESAADAVADVLAVLNDPAGRQRLVDASRNGDAALLGVVRDLEAHDSIRRALEDSNGADRFKQLVGILVKLVMQDLGWSTTGRKGSVATKSAYFRKAERYAPPADQESADRARALAGLCAVSEIGSPQEQAGTQSRLMEALAAQRAEDGRPF